MSSRGADDPYRLVETDEDEAEQQPPPRRPLPASSPKTAWEAVQEAYEIVRTRQTTAPSASSLVPLLDLRARRSLATGPSRRAFNLPAGANSANRNLRAALVQASGAVNSTRCVRCSEGRNIWAPLCVSTALGRPCAGCIYNGQERKCSHHPEFRQPSAPAPPSQPPIADPVDAAATGPLDAGLKRRFEMMTPSQRASAEKKIDDEMAFLAEKKRLLAVVQQEMGDRAGGAVPRRFSEMMGEVGGDEEEKEERERKKKKEEEENDELAEVLGFASF